jgi:hypothetical protein
MSCVGVIDLVDGQLTIQGVAGDEKTTVVAAPAAPAATPARTAP